jgi:hypothetical protein
VGSDIPHTTYSAPGTASKWSYIFVNVEELFYPYFPLEVISSLEILQKLLRLAEKLLLPKLTSHGASSQRHRCPVSAGRVKIHLLKDLLVLVLAAPDDDIRGVAQVPAVLLQKAPHRGAAPSGPHRRAHDHQPVV